MSDPWGSFAASPDRLLTLDRSAVRDIEPSDERLWAGRAAAATESFAHSIGGRGIQFARQAAATATDLLSPLDPFHPSMTRAQAEEMAAKAGVEIGGSVNLEGITPRALSELIRDKQESKRRQQIINESRMSGVDYALSSLLGGLVDPVNFLPLGAVFGAAKGATLAGTVARTATVAAGTGAAFTAAHGGLEEATGTDYTLNDAMHEFVWSTGITAGMLGVAHGLGWALGKRPDIQAKKAALVEETFPEADMTAAKQPVLQLEHIRSAAGDVSDEELADFARRIADAHPDLVANERADMMIDELRAITRADREAEAAARRPSEADVERLKAFMSEHLLPGDVSDADMAAFARKIADAHPDLVANARTDTFIDDLKALVRADKEAETMERTPSDSDRARLRQYITEYMQQSEEPAQARPAGEPPLEQSKPKSASARATDYPEARELRRRIAEAVPGADDMADDLAAEDVRRARETAKALGEDDPTALDYEPIKDVRKVLQEAFTCFTRTGGA